MIDFQTFFIAVTGLLGLMFGSFSNVCVHRIPHGMSVISPGSHCPQCGHAIAWYDNIPLVSWLLLKGRCRHCLAPISARYPALEFLMGLSWGALAWHYGVSPLLLHALVLVSLLWILTLIDLETGLLPDMLTLPGIAVGLGFAYWLGGMQFFTSAAIGAAAGYGLFWGIARLFLLFTGREGMGYGDFKLLAMLGAFMGWQALPFIIFSSSVAGAVIGTVFILTSGKQMRAEIPFGPYLALAGAIWLIWGNDILNWYVALMAG